MGRKLKQQGVEERGGGDSHVHALMYRENWIQRWRRGSVHPMKAAQWSMKPIKFDFRFVLPHKSKLTRLLLQNG